MRYFAFLLIAAALSAAAINDVDIYSTKDLQQLSHKLAEKRTPSATEDLARYGNHYTLLAFRSATGSSEVHEHEADIFIIESGAATLVTGGRLVNPHTVKPGEIRGTSIQNGERRHLNTGDIVHIPAGTPHQLLIDRAAPLTYFVVKVTGQ